MNGYNHVRGELHRGSGVVPSCKVADEAHRLNQASCPHTTGVNISNGSHRVRANMHAAVAKKRSRSRDYTDQK